MQSCMCFACMQLEGIFSWCNRWTSYDKLQSASVASQPWACMQPHMQGAGCDRRLTWEQRCEALSSARAAERAAEQRLGRRHAAPQSSRRRPARTQFQHPGRSANPWAALPARLARPSAQPGSVIWDQPRPGPSSPRPTRGPCPAPGRPPAAPHLADRPAMKPLPPLPQLGGGDEDGYGDLLEGELLEGFEGNMSVHEKLVDADFFNGFPDDFDEDDMALP